MNAGGQVTGPGGARVLHVGLRGVSPAAGRRGEHPLVFLHAFPLDSSMWVPLARILADRGGTAHAFDFPGFGVTPPWPYVEPSLDAVADAAVATLRDGIGAGAAHWVGCSMGGYVALAIAERHPDAVAGLGLMSTRATADDKAGRQRRLAAALDLDARAARGDHTVPDPRAIAEGLLAVEAGGANPLAVDVAAMVSRQRPTALAWAQRAMAARPDRLDVLRRSPGPVAVAWGDHDRVMTREESEAMAAARGVGVTTIAGAGHLTPLEAPAEVATALAALLPER